MAVFQFKVPFIDFFRLRYIALIISGVVILTGVGFFIARGGFNVGVDFKGGVVLQVKVKETVRIDDLRKIMSANNIECQIQTVGDPEQHEFLMKTAARSGDNVAQIDLIETALAGSLGKEDFSVIGSDLVGPTMGRYLIWRAFWLVLLGLLCVLIYVSIRFKPVFAIGGVIALFHDVLVTLTAMAISNKEITVNIIAVILTIIGYSINDTIVVFDRVREDISKYRDQPFKDIVNRAINETLSRTIITSLTVFFTVLAIFFFGGTVLHDFAFALIVGLIAGTYSTVFIAGTLVVEWYNFAAKRKVDKSARQAMIQPATGP